MSHSGLVLVSQDTLLPNDFLYCAQQISSTLAEFVFVWHNNGSDHFERLDVFKYIEHAWMKWHV